MTPLISVLMSSYNYGRFVGEAVDSVLSQDFEDFELIIVDDGSTDSSQDVLKTYKDHPRVKILTQQNQGQAEALNRAFRESRGEVIALIDSDDGWVPHKLRAVAARHHSLKGEYGVLQHNLTVVSDAGRALYKKDLPSGDCLTVMLQTDQINFFVTTTGLCFTRKVLDQIMPIPSEFKVSPDAYLTRTAMVFGPVVSIEEPLGFLRVHAANAGMGKAKTFHRKLRKEILYPALNRFYRKRQIPYEFGVKNEKSFARKGWLKSIAAKLKRWVLKRCRKEP